MTFELGRSLLLSDATTPDALAHALLLVATKSVCLPRALLATQAVERDRLEQELARGDAPVLRHVVPIPALVALVPPGLCERLLALPVRRDPMIGTVDVAVVDARDPHVAEEMSYWLGAPVRVVRTSLAAMELALKRIKPVIDRGVQSLAAPIWVPSGQAVREVTKTPLYGTPAAVPATENGRSEEAPPTERGDILGPKPIAPANIPIPLTRKNQPPIPIIEAAHDSSANGASAPSALSIASTEPMHMPSQPPPPTDDSPPPSSRSVLALDGVPLSRGPITARGPYAPNAPSPPFADVVPKISAMRTAATRDEVIEQLLSGMRTVARRVGIFVVRKDVFEGWTCSPEFGDEAAIRALSVPIGEPTVLAHALSSGAHLGRMMRIEGHAPIFAAMGGAPRDEIVAGAVKVHGRAALVVLASELGDTLLATKRLEELSRSAGDALARILRKKQR